MSNRLTLIVLILLTSFGLYGQGVSHIHDAPNIIDGSVHPELIPDSAAYRLYFVAISVPPDASEVEKHRQRVHLSKASLNETDATVVFAVLAVFKLKYKQIMDDYNKHADKALQEYQTTGTSPTYNDFIARREALVQATRDSLKANMSPAGFASFHANIQNEKHNMKIAKGAQ